MPSADFVPYTEDEADPPVILTVRQPIASIYGDTDTGNLEVEQIARNNFAFGSICFSGKILLYLNAL